MKKNLFLISVCILCMGLISPAWASDQKAAGYNGHFGDMDLDKDDQVNWKEFKAFFPHAEEEIFKEADENADGQIDHDEWHDFKEARGYKHIEKD